MDLHFTDISGQYINPILFLDCLILGGRTYYRLPRNFGDLLKAALCDIRKKEDLIVICLKYLHLVHPSRRYYLFCQR